MEARGLVFEAAGKPLVDGIDLTLEAGLRTLVIGPNGAGKSLLLRLLHGLLPPTAGTVLWRGRTADQAIRRRQAMVFQKPVLLRRSVAANIDYALRVHGLPAAERPDRLQRALGLARLDALARAAGAGAVRRRAAAAGAGAGAGGRARGAVPRRADREPRPGLDAGGRGADRRAHAAGTKIVLVTHDLGQARRLADEVVFLHRGRRDRADRRRHGSLHGPRSEPARPTSPAALSSESNSKGEQPCCCCDGSFLAALLALRGSAPPRPPTNSSSCSRPPRPSSPACSAICCRCSRPKTGIEVRVVAVGTGQAIKNAQNGDGDVLFVHDKPDEEKFVAEG